MWRLKRDKDSLQDTCTCLVVQDSSIHIRVLKEYNIRGKSKPFLLSIMICMHLCVYLHKKKSWAFSLPPIATTCPF